MDIATARVIKRKYIPAALKNKTAHRADAAAAMPMLAMRLMPNPVPTFVASMAVV
jgi:hypothetical protein